MTTTISIPIKALAIEADTGSGVAPEAGDAVTLQVMGKVTSVDGDNAVVSLESANGEPLGSGQEAEAATDENEAAEFERMAQEEG